MVGDFGISQLVDAEENLFNLIFGLRNHLSKRLEPPLAEDLHFDDRKAEKAKELGEHDNDHRPQAPLPEARNVTVANCGHGRCDEVD